MPPTAELAAPKLMAADESISELTARGFRD
jgi:hypothetical protein